MAQAIGADGGRTGMANCVTPIQKWQFAVDFGTGIPVGLFTKSDTPSVEFEEVKFSPAGSAFDEKNAGRASFADVTMEQGISPSGASEDMYKWIQQCLSISDSETVSLGCDYKKDIDIIEYKRDKSENRRWKLANAWIKSIKHGEFEGGSSDLVIETITICYDYYRMVNESSTAAQTFGSPFTAGAK